MMAALVMRDKSRRIVLGLAGGTLAVSLAACGGGSSSPTTQSTPRPTPTPPPPVVVAQGGGTLPAEFVTLRAFTTTVAGSLTATVDWTLVTNDMDIYLVSGTCTFDQFFAQQCPVLALSESSTAKPEQVTVAQAPAGSYTLFAYNVGPGDESWSFQVVLTPGASARAASEAGAIVFRGLKKQPRGVVELR